MNHYPTITTLLERRVPAFPTQPTELTLLEYARAVVRMLHRDCEDWLTEAGAHPLYRGVRNPPTQTSPVQIRTVRQDRRPLHAPPGWDEAMRNEIDRRGLVANRHNSMFATTSYEISTAFGTPTIVFPVGRFNYTWSPAAKDPYAWLTRLGRDNTGTLSTLIQQLAFRGDDGSLREALERSHELMIRCERYVCIEVSFAKTYVLPILYKKKFDPAIAFERWSSGEYAV